MVIYADTNIHALDIKLYHFHNELRVLIHDLGQYATGSSFLYKYGRYLSKADKAERKKPSWAQVVEWRPPWPQVRRSGRSHVGCACALASRRLMVSIVEKRRLKRRRYVQGLRT